MEVKRAKRESIPVWYCKDCKQSFSIGNIYRKTFIGYWGNRSLHPYCPSCGGKDNEMV